MTRRRSDGQQNVGGDAHIAPSISFPCTFCKRTGGRGRPPLQFVFGNVIQTAGRIISAPTIPHTLFKPPGGRGRRPPQFVSADVVRSAGRPRAASPTMRQTIHFAEGRADNIRPYISAHIFQTIGTSRTPSPTICSGRCCRIGWEAEGGLPYRSFPIMLSKRPGG